MKLIKLVWLLMGRRIRCTMCGETVRVEEVVLHCEVEHAGDW
jgi:hypothetical protein